MKQLSTICVLAVLTGLVPFLAVPLWVMRVLLIVFAAAILLLACYLRFDISGILKELSKNTPDETATSSSQTKTFSTDDPAKNRAGEKSKNTQKPQEAANDPEADRFAKQNSYADRQKNLRS